MKLFNFKKKQPEKVQEIDNSKNDLLQLSFTSQSGVEFYTFKDFTKIPALRAIAGERATRFSDLMITENLLKQAVKKYKEFTAKNKIIEAHAIINEIDVRLQMFGEQETLIEVASCYALFRNESPEQMKSDFQRKKKELCIEDNSVQAFFLEISLSLINRYSNTSSEDMQMYLKETLEIANRLNLITGENLLSNSRIV